MERTARLLLTRAVALRKANHLALRRLRREHTLHIRFLDVRFTWYKLLP
jgi:hypothetical protein